MSTHTLLPTLYVEGKDDVSVINALLARHGIDTQKGQQQLRIQDQGSIDTLLENMPQAIKAATDRLVGFVVDIDIELINRWSAVRGRLSEVGIAAPPSCPSTGYFGQLPDYPYRFGVWLMPDCATDYQKLEHLCQSLIPDNDPLWEHAQASVTEAVKLIDEVNSIIADPERQWKRFSEADLIKSEIHSWLAWQRPPGKPLGAAINAHILGHDSPQALALVQWLRDLYGFP